MSWNLAESSISAQASLALHPSAMAQKGLVADGALAEPVQAKVQKKEKVVVPEGHVKTTCKVCAACKKKKACSNPTFVLKTNKKRNMKVVEEKLVEQPLEQPLEQSLAQPHEEPKEPKEPKEQEVCSMHPCCRRRGSIRIDSD